MGVKRRKGPRTAVSVQIGSHNRGQRHVFARQCPAGAIL